MGKRKRKGGRKHIELKMGLPKDFVDKLEFVYSPTDVTDIISNLRKVRPTTLRVNSLKYDLVSLQEFLRSRSINYQRVQNMPLAVVLPQTTSRDVTEWPIYQEGKIYLQNLSSQLPPIILDPKPGEKVLDLAAAPGSKTTQMAAMMEKKGKLLGNDKTYPRFKRLEANAIMQIGEDSVGVCTRLSEFPEGEFLELQNLPGEVIGKNLSEVFDKVLIDAPCSSEGQFEVDNYKSYSFWSRHKAKEMQSKQKPLLLSALRAAKVGAEIVYATCTYAPEENEAVIDWALKKFPGVFEVLKIDLSLKNARPGILKYGQKEFNPLVKKTMRVLPGDGFEGFYVAKLKKIASVPERNIEEEV